LFILFTAYLKLYEQLYFKVFFIKKYKKKSNCLRGNAERLIPHAKDPEGMKGSHLMPRTQKAIVAKIMQRLRGNVWRVEYILSLYSMDVFGVIHLSCGYSIYNNIIFH
jgi:hypothetical protein